MSSKTLDFTLHDAQLEVFRSKARFKVLVAGRRFGKSYLAVISAITAALSPKNTKKKDVWIVAPTFNQAKGIYWNLLTDLAHPVIESIRVNEGIIKLVNGVQIAIKGADRPDSLRGIGLFMVILDEYADMKADVWEVILRPALADVRGDALFIGTPKGRNHFFLLVQEAVENKTGEFELFQFVSANNPYLPPEEIESAKNTMSSAAFRQEFLATFESGGSENFKRDWLKYNEEEPKEGDFFIAVDLAGFEEVSKAVTTRHKRLDSTAIAVVKVNHGSWWVAEVKYGRWNVKQTAEKIVLLAKAYQPKAVGIEKGSLKNAVDPYLSEAKAQHKVSFEVTPLTHGNKEKTNRILWALQGRMEHGKVTLNPGEWNKEFEDQLLNFPSRMVHDDMLDALSYVDQLAEQNLFDISDFDIPDYYWKPEDSAVGF